MAPARGPSAWQAGPLPRMQGAGRGGQPAGGLTWEQVTVLIRPQLRTESLLVSGSVRSQTSRRLACGIFSCITIAK